MNTNVTHCTVCGNEFKDMRITVKLNIESDRKTENETWEIIGNMNLRSAEIMCNSCFDRFAETLPKAMNNTTSGE